MSKRSRTTLQGNISQIFTPSVTRENTYSIPGKSNSKLKNNDFQNQLFDQNSLKFKTEKVLTSTQELKIDFSKFENHTFFESAVSKTSQAFNKIINEYPFDGRLDEIESYESNLTGFEKYVFDNFPKNVGYLVFSGTQKGEVGSNGQYIIVNDAPGSKYPDFSRNKSSNPVLDPLTSSFTMEFFLNVPSQANDNQVLFQRKVSLANNITIALSESASSNNCKILFGITQDSKNLFASASIPKGEFNQYSFVYERERDLERKVKIFKNSELLVTSSNQIDIENLTFNFKPLTIASGSEVRINEAIFTPQQTFSGSIDEFRYFHKAKVASQIKSDLYRNVYKNPNDRLVLYFKFNEPSNTTEIPSTVLDSSGNSLHSGIENYSSAMRVSSSTSTVRLERLDRNPVLFASHPTIQSLNSELLLSGSEYDDANPNLITKMVPVHYFLEGNEEEGFETVLGNLSNAFDTQLNIPGSGKLGSAQLLVTFLMVWAKFFDELKLFIDSFSNLSHVNYDDKETIPDIFLETLARKYGITLPDLFAGSSIDQFYDGEDVLSTTTSRMAYTLREIQNQVWRRILTITPKLMKKKGTLQSVRSVFLSVGINPDDFVEIREYGGPKTKTLENSRETKQKVIRLLDFTGSIGKENSSVDYQGFGESPYIISQYLSSSRNEIGLPHPVGTFVRQDGFYHGVSNNPSDGLHTSGAFSFEGIYQFDSKTTHPPTQSLARLFVTGTASPSSKQGLIANLLLISGSVSELRFVTRPSFGSTSESTHTVRIYSASIFDGTPWNVSFARIPKDYTGNESFASGSYILRCARQNFGKITDNYTTTSFFLEDSSGNSSNIVYQNISSNYNTSGSFLVIGSQSIGNTSAQYFLNDSTLDNSVRATKFTGKVGQIRFWSKGLTDVEFKEHVRNFKSKGVDNPYVNYNFNKSSSGSFERLRLDVHMNQLATASNASGNLTLFDFSQNNLHFEGKQFESSKQAIKGTYYSLSQLSPNFDRASSSDKVRVRGLEDSGSLDRNPYAKIGRVYEFDYDEEPDDDTRFSIDYSLVKGLNEDMMTQFSSLDFFDNALGKPNQVFTDSYRELELQREIYFQNLTAKLDVDKYYKLFKWFDTTFSDLILTMLPRKTQFMGINFVVESHVLERHKMKYFYDEIYLNAIERNTDKGNLLLSQFVGKVKKF